MLFCFRFKMRLLVALAVVALIVAAVDARGGGGGGGRRGGGGGRGDRGRIRGGPGRGGNHGGPRSPPHACSITPVGGEEVTRECRGEAECSGYELAINNDAGELAYNVQFCGDATLFDLTKFLVS